MVSRERKQMKEKFGDREEKKKQQVCLPGRHRFCSMCAGKAVTAGRSLAFFSPYFLLGSGEQFALLIQVCRSTSGPPSGTKWKKCEVFWWRACVETAALGELGAFSPEILHCAWITLYLGPVQCCCTRTKGRWIFLTHHKLWIIHNSKKEKELLKNAA